MATVSAFRWVPPFAYGLVRDLRVRWALEEAGRGYDERLISQDDKNSASYRALQPFGQVPAYEENGLDMFESGAIVLHIAEKSDALMPQDEGGRARAKTWMFAALNTIEPSIMLLNFLDRQTESANPAHRQNAVDAIKTRLDVLAKCLGQREYLEDRFTAGDLLMTTVLRILHNTTLVSDIPALDAYRKRCEARPAFQKALADQLAPFAKNAPPAA
jgi:glutathione S-transferase